mmetsp:Transcript_26055/g.60814  ORF Transcript_26055/g.60814 Transcript_26055/m.60814 type:complete len:214 (-) Transcript_26055:1889-2530(-)
MVPIPAVAAAAPPPPRRRRRSSSASAQRNTPAAGPRPCSAGGRRPRQLAARSWTASRRGSRGRSRSRSRRRRRPAAAAATTPSTGAVTASRVGATIAWILATAARRRRGQRHYWRPAPDPWITSRPPSRRSRSPRLRRPIRPRTPPCKRRRRRHVTNNLRARCRACLIEEAAEAIGGRATAAARAPTARWERETAAIPVLVGRGCTASPTTLR